MKTLTAKLTADLRTLERRREALATEEQKARLTLEDARRALIERPTESGVVTSAQATHAALSDALAGVDDELARLRSELSDAQASDAREAKITRLVELASSGAAHFTEHESTRSELNAALLAGTSRLIAAQSAVSQARRDFLQTFSELVPHVQMHPHWSHPDPAQQRKLEQGAAALLTELRGRGANLDVVLSPEFGPGPSQIDAEDLRRRMAAVEPFGEVFRTLIAVAEEHARQQAIAAAESSRAGSPASESALTTPDPAEWELFEKGQSGGVYRRRAGFPMPSQPADTRDESLSLSVFGGPLPGENVPLPVLATHDGELRRTTR